MGWMIEKDNIDSNMRMDSDRRPINNPVKFRLLDDDGTIYYEGLISNADLCGDEFRAFAPLDVVGFDAGCTEMQYFKDHQWKTL